MRFIWYENEEQKERSSDTVENSPNECIWSGPVWRRSLKWCLSMQRNQNIVETNNVRPENGKKRRQWRRERGQTLVRRAGRRNADDGESNKRSSQNVYADVGRHSHCGLSFHDSNLLEIKETEAPATVRLCVCVPKTQSWPNMLEFEWQCFFLPRISHGFIQLLLERFVINRSAYFKLCPFLRILSTLTLPPTCWTCWAFSFE